jgi:hypothetical protein
MSVAATGVTTSMLVRFSGKTPAGVYLSSASAMGSAASAFLGASLSADSSDELLSLLLLLLLGLLSETSP